MPIVDTLSLTTVITGKPAPTPDGKNILIKIDIGRDTATFNCQPVEHVGKHKNRHVTFQVDAACTLHFTNFAVFQANDWPLVKGKHDLPVLDPTNGVETSYSLDVGKGVDSPVKIVVP
jgi:hypothetical protein